MGMTDAHKAEEDTKKMFSDTRVKAEMAEPPFDCRIDSGVVVHCSATPAQTYDLQSHWEKFSILSLQKEHLDEAKT